MFKKEMICRNCINGVPFSNREVVCILNPDRPQIEKPTGVFPFTHFNWDRCGSGKWREWNPCEQEWELRSWGEWEEHEKRNEEQVEEKPADTFIVEVFDQSVTAGMIAEVLESVYIQSRFDITHTGE